MPAKVFLLSSHFEMRRGQAVSSLFKLDDKKPFTWHLVFSSLVLVTMGFNEKNIIVCLVKL